jgi:hypothetical protein
MEFVPNAQNYNEPNDNQAAPPNLQTLLQKIRRFRLPSDENINVKNIKDSITLVDANPVKFPIFTKHHHYQLLNLCELSTGKLINLPIMKTIANVVQMERLFISRPTAWPCPNPSLRKQN